MIIPNYNDGTVDVHLKLDENEASLSNENIAAKAFSYMTGLKSGSRITETSFEGVEYQVFITDSLRITIVCEKSDITNGVTVVSSVMIRDKATNDVIVKFSGAIFGKISNEKDIIPMIDFLFEYNEELFTIKSGIII